jgi:hypothetical protein
MFFYRLAMPLSLITVSITGGTMNIRENVEAKMYHRASFACSMTSTLTFSRHSMWPKTQPPNGNVLSRSITWLHELE